MKRCSVRRPAVVPKERRSAKAQRQTRSAVAKCRTTWQTWQTWIRYDRGWGQRSSVRSRSSQADVAVSQVRPGPAVNDIRWWGRTVVASHACTSDGHRHISTSSRHAQKRRCPPQPTKRLLPRTARRSGNVGRAALATTRGRHPQQLVDEALAHVEQLVEVLQEGIALKLPALRPSVVP